MSSGKELRAMTEGGSCRGLRRMAGTRPTEEGLHQWPAVFHVDGLLTRGCARHGIKGVRVFHALQHPLVRADMNDFRCLT